jgi:hypothetical protein
VCRGVALLALVVAGLRPGAEQGPAAGPATPEARAMGFLAVEVPRWSRENRCFSCHNNGDAARALYQASRVGLARARRSRARPPG